MSTLEELRAQRVAELQQQQMQQFQSPEAQQEFALRQQLSQLEEGVKRHLSKDALSRYGTLKVAHPDNAIQLLLVLGRLIQAGRVAAEISDDQLKELLRQLPPQKRETKITRR